MVAPLIRRSNPLRHYKLLKGSWPLILSGVKDYDLDSGIPAYKSIPITLCEAVHVAIGG